MISVLFTILYTFIAGPIFVLLGVLIYRNSKNGRERLAGILLALGGAVLFMFYGLDLIFLDL